MIFDNAESAYRWALEVINIRESTHTGSFEPSHGRQCGAPRDYTFLDAVYIKSLSEKSCKAGIPCPYFNEHCFEDWLLPTEENRPSDAEIKRIEDCLSDFADRLRKKGYLE